MVFFLSPAAGSAAEIKGSVDLQAPGEAYEPAQDAALGKWALWPDGGPVFSPAKADPRAPHLRFGFMYNKGRLYMDINAGGDLGVFSYEWSPEERLTVTARGVFTSRFDVASESFDLLNMDFIGGVAVGYKHGPHEIETFIHHQSSHLGDEILFKGRKLFDYSREGIRALYAFRWNGFRFYGGGMFNVHAWPVELQYKFTAQLGAEYNFKLFNQPMFAAADFQSRQENDWSVNTSFQLGVELGDPAKTKTRQFVFFEAFQGYSNMGQYWKEWESYQMIGIGIWFR